MNDTDFRNLIEALPMGVVVHRDRRILHANRACLRTLGLERLDQLLGRDPIGLLSGQPDVYAQRAAALMRGEQLPPIDARLTSPGGRSRALEIRGVRVDFEGAPTIFTLVREVTAERQAQAELLASEACCRAVLEASPQATITMDQHGLVAGLSPAAERLFGFSRSEAVGRRVTDLLLAEAQREAHQAGLEDHLAASVTRFTGRLVELNARRADGSELPVELAIARIEMDGPPLFAAFIRDLTERRALQRARERDAGLAEEDRRVLEANRLKSKFLAGMSHAVRTPLNAIVGFADLLHSGELGPISDAQRDPLEAILVSSHHLLRLINDVLDLARIESGKVEFRPVPVDLRTVVSDAVGNFTPATTRKDIALRVDLDPQLTRAVVDPARLRQVLHNYLSNAVKFSDRGGSITVRLRAEDGRRFRIEVEDTGAGIRPEDLERLFVEFQQLDARPARTYQGTGMGLALTRRIVEAQGGQVGASSEPGKGSTFYAVLPLLTPVTRHEGQDHWQR